MSSYIFMVKMVSSAFNLSRISFVLFPLAARPTAVKHTARVPFPLSFLPNLWVKVRPTVNTEKKLSFVHSICIESSIIVVQLVYRLVI